MIKKIVLSLLLTYGTLANAGTYYLDDAKKMKVDTPYNLMVIDGVTDLEVAIYLGKVDYLKQALKTDPELIKKINNVMGTTPESPLGFNPKNVEMLNFMLQYDQGLLNRKNGEKRNILLNVLVQHFEFYHSDEPKKEIDRFLKELANRKFAYMPEIQNALLKGRPVPEMEYLALSLVNSLQPNILNESDKWGNNALHYATYIRKPNIVRGLLDNRNFRASNNPNMYGENALFMLLNNNCNVNSDKNVELQILKNLLSARVNPLSRNEKGISFAGMVYAFDDYNHMKPLLDDYIGPLRKKLVLKEAEQLKELLTIASSKDVKNSYASSFVNASEYTAFTCDMKKMKY